VSYVIERVVTPRSSLASQGLEPVNPNADHAEPLVPRLDDFVVDPFAICSGTADQNNGARSAIHLPTHPSLDCRIAAVADLLPVVIGCGPISLDRTDLPNLRRPLAVELVVKAEEAPSGHRCPLLQLHHHYDENRYVNDFKDTIHDTPMFTAPACGCHHTKDHGTTSRVVFRVSQALYVVANPRAINTFPDRTNSATLYGCRSVRNASSLSLSP
jgi:hypothetical protein